MLALATSIAAVSVRAATPDALETSVADGMRPAYAMALERTGPGSERVRQPGKRRLKQSASAMLAARPDTCALADWLALGCGARSLIDPSLAMAPSLMAPSLMVGDTVLTVPADDSRPLRRGDVLAFRDPDAKDPDTATIYVSRLIGMPGEHIALHDGIIMIDGKAVPRQPTGKTVTLDGLGNAVALHRNPSERADLYHRRKVVTPMPHAEPVAARDRVEAPARASALAPALRHGRFAAGSGRGKR